MERKNEYKRNWVFGHWKILVSSGSYHGLGMKEEDEGKSE